MSQTQLEVDNALALVAGLFTDPGLGVAERVEDGANGYTVSAYAAHVGSARLAYFKISCAPTTSYFEAQACVFKGSVERLENDDGAALDCAFVLANRLLEQLPPASVLMRQLHGRALTSFGWHVLTLSMAEPGSFVKRGALA